MEDREAKGGEERCASLSAAEAGAASCGFYAAVELTHAQAHPQKPPRSHPDS